MSRSLLTHRAAAALWAALAVPAALWWRDAVWFVIAASVWANVYAALAAAEAADDRRVMDRLDRLAELLDRHPGGTSTMAPTTPSLGRIVHYRLSEQDAAAVNSRREDARAHTRLFSSTALIDPGKPGRTGHVAHVGNDVRAGDVFPAVIVRVWSTAGPVNLQVLLDGTDTLWATSVAEGDGERQYAWPPRV